MPIVDLVYDPACPNVALARANLMRAFSKARISARWEEHRIGAPDGEARVIGFGSPTVLVDGRDVAQAEAGADACCRIYTSGDVMVGAPPIDAIAAALTAAVPAGPMILEKAAAKSLPSKRWRITAAALPGLGVALMPKIVCPLCWPAYAGVLSATGLTFLMNDKWLFPIMALCLLAALAALTWNAKARWGYGPVVVGTAAAVAILTGRFALDSEVAVYGGVGALIAASTWNAWPRRATTPRCSGCVEVKN
jgi:hypothetical protein